MTRMASKQVRAAKCLALALAAWAALGGAGAQAQVRAEFDNFGDGYCYGQAWAMTLRISLVCNGYSFLLGKYRPAMMRYDLATRQTTRVALTPPNVDAIGSATNQSRSGNCVVGLQDAGAGTRLHAFRWTEAGGPVDLGTLVPADNANLSSHASAVSDDCSVVVGASQTSAGAEQAFRWTAAGGMVSLGAPAGAGFNSRAFGVSGAGDVVVGQAEFVDANHFSGYRTGAFRWTAAGGFQSLGAIEPGFFTTATAVTADGSVVVGNGAVAVRIGNTTTNGSRAFRWSQGTGLVPLGPLPGDRFADAAGISDDGRIVVGTSSTGPLDRFNSGGRLRGEGRAFRWAEATGMQDLRELLVAAGVDMSGITLVSVTGLSPDGQWIVGQARTASAPLETMGYLVQYCDDAIGAACTTAAAAASFTLAAAPSTLSVPAGQAASTTLTITPEGGFSSAVSFACSGLPQGAACSFAPASVTPAGSAVNTTLTISTDGGPVALWLREHPALALALVLPMLGRLRPGTRLGARRAAWLATALLAGWLVACGGGGGDSGAGGGGSGGGGSGGGSPPPPATGTPAGTSTVTVTATAGSGASALSRTLTLTLNVTR